MTEKLLVGLLAVGVIFLGFIAFPTTPRQGVGATIGYLSSVGQQLTFNAFNSLLQDVVNTRSPLSGLVTTTTASISFPVVTTTTPNTTTTSAGIAALQGDLVLISPATSTAGIVYSANVSVASSTSATLEIKASLATTTQVTPATTTFNVWVLPAASFKGPAAIITATSSSAN